MDVLISQYLHHRSFLYCLMYGIPAMASLHSPHSPGESLNIHTRSFTSPPTNSPFSNKDVFVVVF